VFPEGLAEDICAHVRRHDAKHGDDGDDEPPVVESLRLWMRTVSAALRLRDVFDTIGQRMYVSASGRMSGYCNVISCIFAYHKTNYTYRNITAKKNRS